MPAALFGLRTAASGMLALYIAFVWQIDQPGWAAAPAIVGSDGGSGGDRAGGDAAEHAGAEPSAHRSAFAGRGIGDKSRAATGGYAQTGVRALSLVDAKSFWIDAYFEETIIPRLAGGDRATIRLMGDPGALRGHVDSLARGIQPEDATEAGWRA